MRNLASLKVIDRIEEIHNSDNIELAFVGGWPVIVKKGEFKPGDYGVYHEIDSWLPYSNPNYSFLMKEEGANKVFDGIEGYRLRSMKMRGQLSQGLLLPLSSLLGLDLSESLGIKKWEKFLPIHAEAKGNFPSFIPKTDQERVQNLTRNMELWAEEGNEWEITEKLDGSSMSVYLKGDDFGVCSRNLELKQSEDNTFWQTAINYDLENKLKQLCGDYALQGELVSYNIQGNPYKLDTGESHFYVFDVFDIENQKYLNSEDRLCLCDSLEIPHIPVIDKSNLNQSVDFILELSEGKSKLNCLVEREGIVFKNTIDPSKSFKAVSNKWLLKQG